MSYYPRFNAQRNRLKQLIYTNAIIYISAEKLENQYQNTGFG